MIFYKYTKKPGLTKIPGYESTSNTNVISKYLDTDSILSEIEPILENGEEFVCNIADGLMYQYRSHTRENFTQSTVVDSIVASTCKLGLAVYDSTKTERSEIYRLGKNDHAIMNMGFVTDANNNIWASVSVIGDDLSYTVEKGYVIYKNARNNFTNLYIPDAKYKTVLTDGKLDQEKIKIVQNQENNQIALLSNSSVNLRGTSATTRVVWKKTDSRSKYSVTRVSEDTSKKSYVNKIATRDPSIVQNNANFPRKIGKVGGVYQYDYTIDCNRIDGLKDLSTLHKHENIDVDSIRMNFKYNTTYYNRFKTAIPDDVLSRGFMHIFFTRPDCNLINPSTGKLLSDIKNNPSLSYIYSKKPELVKELVLKNGSNHEFMMLLSNKAKNFSLTDEGITFDKYGKTFGGYSVAFGRRKDSELGGSFDISYNDTRDLDIINLHKLWIDYINNVYRGIWDPKINYIYEKIIDYACSVYVIITAEDFETILFWTKYYGVFPINVPYNALSWQGNGLITNPEFSITYQYSWKEDYNPLGLTELNVNTFRTSHPTKVAYIPTYAPDLGRTGYTWVGAPFVETIKFGPMERDKTNGTKVVSKLRFKKE